MALQTGRRGIHCQAAHWGRRVPLISVLFPLNLRPASIQDIAHHRPQVQLPATPANSPPLPPRKPPNEGEKPVPGAGLAAERGRASLPGTASCLGRAAGAAERTRARAQPKVSETSAPGGTDPPSAPRPTGSTCGEVPAANQTLRPDSSSLALPPHAYLLHTPDLSP
jgi:hypothetical protein